MMQQQTPGTRNSNARQTNARKSNDRQSHTRRSITRRLMLGLTLGSSLLWCIGAGYASFASYREMSETLDGTLRQLALRLLPLGRDDVMGHESDDERAIARFGASRSTHLMYRLTDASGRVLLLDSTSPNIPWKDAARAGFSSAGSYRFYRETDPHDGLTITVAASLHDRDEALYASILSLLLPLLALVPLNILVIWLTVRGAVRPIDRLTQEIADRGGQNLAPLDMGDQPRELRPIADAIASLMERLRTALDAERAFAAHSAHELRTPIAGALAQTQRLMAAAREPDARRRAGEIEQTLQRLARLSEKLLQLSRLDAGLGRVDEPVDLRPVLDIVVMDATAHWNAEERLNYDPGPEKAFPVAMDADAFAIAVRNLLDNAFLHGEKDGQVDVRVDWPARSVHVSSHGTPVPPEVLSGLTHRFVRGSKSAEGSGLGLAIVDTFMRQSGGSLDLRSPSDDGRYAFDAILHLPDGRTGRA